MDITRYILTDLLFFILMFYFNNEDWCSLSKSQTENVIEPGAWPQ
jgi:hypothetical protein